MSLKSSVIIKYLLPIGDRLMGTDLSNQYKEIKLLENKTKKGIEEWQFNRLVSIVNYAFNHTKYYHRKFIDYGININNIANTDDLHKLPVLYKEDIRNNYEDLIPDNINELKYKISSTGGSTGQPLRYIHDKKSWSFVNALTIRHWERVGYNYGDIHLALGSTSLFVNKEMSIKHRLYYKLKNKYGANGVNMSDEICNKYINIIRNKQIKYIYGYASSIYVLAKYVKNHNIPLNIHACFPTSEVLTENYRSVIQNAFRCSIINCYGANDGGIRAFEHIKNYFEVGYNCLTLIENEIDRNKNHGSVLLTDLYNFAMPLINYKIEDEITIQNENNYNYNGQIFKSVDGRTSEVIELENGKKLTGPGFTILFKDLPVEYYCIQKNGMNELKCLIIKGPNYSNHTEELIEQTIKKNAGESSSIEIKYVDKPLLSSSGKRIYFKGE